ncbi:acyl-CoA-binding domain-containing protein 5-like isoform X2 [Amphiura filiformis]|uniref:acyl-CoA-binding domain-containing protein 5-like isoform X2 n=1 Tax=Amphiura filiformis TaxID=82378 RepID=UPI003B21ADFA
MASAKQKFDAAVTLIQSLPKDGPFQPSYGMMKKFYGLYKQATLGPCNEPKPAFWEAVRRTKWEAWNALGSMSKEVAMKTYVDEMLKIMMANAKAKDLPHMMQIVETMPHTDEVGNFRQVMGPFFEAMQESPKKHKLTNGDIPHENGEDGLSEDSGRGEDDQEMTSQNVSEATQFVTVDVSMVANKESKAIGPAGDTTDATDESHPILIEPNGTHDSSSGTYDGSRSDSEESESGSEVFQDSMDQPDLDKLPPLVVPSERLGNGPILTSTPHRQEIITQAEVHEESTQNITQPYLSNGILSAAAATKRGGGEVTPGGKGQAGRGQQKDQGGQNEAGGRRRGSGRGSSEPDGRGSSSSGGASGGGGPGKRGAPIAADVSEQISTALERLQRDMNSVLIRLNTLEALALARQQAEHEDDFRRAPEGATSLSSRRRGPWWLFKPLPKASVFFLLLWPLIVHWLLKYLSRRRRHQQRF